MKNKEFMFQLNGQRKEWNALNECKALFEISKAFEGLKCLTPSELKNKINLTKIKTNN